jgi:hypothetical protein
MRLEQLLRPVALWRVCAVVALSPCFAIGQTAPPKMKMTTDIPAAITTPDSVETRLGTLNFSDGFPDDVAAVEVHLVDAEDRDDVFEAGGVLVGHGCAEEDARSG